MTRKRKVPLRKCIVTKEMKPKDELIRVVRNKEGEVFVDPTGKKNGRGAYLSKDTNIIEQAKATGVLNDQFKVKIDDNIFETLIEMVSGSKNG